jgi:hypothetical protein
MARRLTQKIKDAAQRTVRITMDESECLPGPFLPRLVPAMLRAHGWYGMTFVDAGRETKTLVHPDGGSVTMPSKTSENTIGYYGAALHPDGTIRILWCERVRTPDGPMPTRAAGSWWLSASFPATRAGERAADAEVTRRNRINAGSAVPPMADEVEAKAA